MLYSLIRMGEPARALTVAQQTRTRNDAVFLAFLWNHYTSDLRKLASFPCSRGISALADVWDQYGPPDTCRHVGARDYVCE